MFMSLEFSLADVLERYEQEKMEFGATLPMFTILSSLAMINLLCLIGLVIKVIWVGEVKSFHQNLAL
ncbi:hypothetical protein C2S52_015957 [Perilla frutescens var. hirtella]|nr:hypothetical protein C2S52_015957 [Perilla frutescens var. hirtella]